MKLFRPALVSASAALAIGAMIVGATRLPRVDHAVHRKLQRQATVNLIVTMRETTASVLESFERREASFPSRGEKISALVDTLETHATQAQSDVTKMLAHEAAGVSASEVRSFWISNQMYFRDASLGLVEKLAAMPSVATIEEERVIPMPTFKLENATRVSLLANEWGVAKVGAPKVWEAGVDGTDVVVGGIDTGVLATHSRLRGNYRPTYGWFDAVTKRAAPFDDNGHGTHTMGSIAGAGGIGVAPGVKWIACRACETENGCPESALLSCAQFMTCPTTPTGLNKDCSKAPHVINNSWGGGQGNTFYDAAISAWRAANIVPVFANGNTGPACRTASSPADNANVIAVGATDVNDGLGSFSSKGPSVKNLLKPEISAPGVMIRSAWSTGTNVFNAISGTSMATPHVTGIIALLLSADPTLKFDRIKTLLIATATRETLKQTGYNCDPSSSEGFPNNEYGYGRVNAFSAFEVAMSLATLPPLPTRRPKPPPTPAPTPAPTIPAGSCSGLNVDVCQSTFFCTWNELNQNCQRWWT